MHSQIGAFWEAVAATRVVIFDFDGTLVSLPVDWPSLKADLQAIFQVQYGLGLTFDSLSRGLRMVERCLGQRGLDVAHAVIRAHEAKSVAGVVAYPKVVHLVKQLYAQGKLLAIFSANQYATVDSTLRRLGLRSHFHHIVGMDTVVRSKPDPEGLFQILNKFGLQPSEAIYIGDQEVDQVAGFRSGIRTFLVHRLRSEDINA